MIRRRLTGLLASLLIVAILAGLPSLLLAVGGSTFPAQWPAIDQVRDYFTSPDDGSLALRAIILLGWLVWVALSGTIIAEIIASIRGTKPSTLPAVNAPHLAVRQLVAAAALLFVSAHTMSGTPVAYADDSNSPPTPTTARATNVPTQSPAEIPPTAAALMDHVVGSTDTLSGLARSYLGDGERWPEIFEASKHIVQPDGEQLANPDLIRDGWTLRIPITTLTTSSGQSLIEHTVGPADTLSGLAKTYLGDASRWPEIFEASNNLIQADGQQLTNPDLLEIGWQLRIPGPAQAAEEETQAAGAPQIDAPDQSDNQTAGPAATQTPETSAQHGPRPPATTEAAPPTTAPPQQSSAPQPPATSDASDTDEDETEEIAAPWLLTGLATGGMVLATSALLALRARRRQQFRERRPGRAIAPSGPQLAPVEKTITAVGTEAAPTVGFMDDTLRRLAATRLAHHEPMPALTAVELRANGALVLHLAHPAKLPEPWEAADSTQQVWQLPVGVVPAVASYQYDEQPAPYPVLVTIGSTEAGDTWLINLEQIGAVQVIGDPDYCTDYLRYTVAELALNPWSRNTTVSCVGLEEVTAINPERISSTATFQEAIAQTSRTAEATVSTTNNLDADAPTARAAQLTDEVWGAHVLVASNEPDHDSDQLPALVEVIMINPNRTATAVITKQSELSGVGFEFSDQGRVTIAELGLDLISVGLTRDEALGCAQLLSVGTAAEDIPMPVSKEAEGWQVLADEAGALRQEWVIPRSAAHQESSTKCLIDQNAQLPASALPADLEVLDPKVPERTTTKVLDSDPDLDADVADWFSPDCPRPRLTLLGPVGVRAHGSAIAKRKPFYTEVLSFIALRERGATVDELATALGYTNFTTVRTAVKTVRDWLGPNPRTGGPHLPNAAESQAAKQRGVPVYQVEDLLIDIDLFRRLRLRGQARGPQGIDDLVAALSLVTGRPFDQLRPRGWTWLVDTSTDHHMTCAIVDVAHLLTVHFLQSGELDRARAATETALLAAPYDDIPKLDLAAILNAEGHEVESRMVIDQDICNDVEDDGLPSEIGQRTDWILARGNLEQGRGKRAS